MNSIVVFEPPHQKREIPQCTKCQQYGHTQKFCYRQARCVKCAGNHATKDCTRKERSDDVKCVLCGANHPANYKGCIIYKDLQKKTYPTLRAKSQIPPPKPVYNNINNYNQNYPNLSSQKSYANITSGVQQQQQSSQFITPSSQPNVINPQSPQQNSNLELMLSKMMDKMESLLNLLTTMLTKMF